MKYIILLLVICLGLTSCNNNEDDHCEFWKVQEWVVDKSTNQYLQNPIESQKTFCNNDIKTAGTTIVWSETNNAKFYRKFIQKL